MTNDIIDVTGPEVMIKRRNVVFDASLLTSWMSCKRLTDFVHNMNLVPIGGKGNPLEAGSLVHHILKTYYKNIRDGRPRSLAISAALDEGERYWKGDPSNEGVYPGCQAIPLENIDHPNGHLKSVGYTHIVSTMQQYFLHYSNEHWVPIDIEKVKSEVLYEDEEIRVLWKTKFDLTVDTNQGIYPVDHKTMKQKHDTLSLNNQFMGQCVLAKTNSMILNKIGFQKTAKPVDKFLRPMMNYSSDRLREWIQLVGFYAKEYADYQEGKFFPPNFTNCDKFNGCLFRGICESDRSMREQELKLHFVVGEPWEPIDD